MKQKAKRKPTVQYPNGRIQRTVTPLSKNLPLKHVMNHNTAVHKCAKPLTRLRTISPESNHHTTEPNQSNTLIVTPSIIVWRNLLESGAQRDVCSRWSGLHDWTEASWDRVRVGRRGTIFVSTQPFPTQVGTHVPCLVNSCLNGLGLFVILLPSLNETSLAAIVFSVHWALLPLFQLTVYVFTGLFVQIKRLSNSALTVLFSLEVIQSCCLVLL